MVTGIPRLLFVVLSAALLVVLALVMGGSSLNNTAEAGEAALKPEMSLSAHGTDVTCDGQPSTSKGAVPKPLKCDVPLGGTFIVSIAINEAPAAGYTRWQTILDYGSLIYKKAPAATDEIVVPCSVSERVNFFPDQVLYGCSNSPAKTHTVGNIVELEFNCPGTKSVHSIELTTASFGTFFIEFGGNFILPNLSPLGINCVNPPPEISLSAHGLAVKCDSQPSVNKGDVPKPAKCDVPLGGEFTVSIEINTAPAAGYDAWVTELDYGALIYKKAPAATDEIVVPCGVPDRVNTPTAVVHICDNSPTKTHTVGNIVELEFNCTGTKSVHSIDLIDVLSGAIGTFFDESGTSDFIEPNFDALGINCVNPPQDGQININVVNADNQTQKLADTCWLISVNHFDGMSFVNKPFDIVSDNNAKPAICDALGPIKGDLSDKDPAVGSIAVTIPAAEIEFWDSIEWHFQQVQAPDNYNVDTNKWVCTLSGLNKKAPPNEELIACDEANPFVVKNVAKSPPNDGFLTRTVVGGLPYSDAVVTKAATLELNDPVISCKGAYGHSVWYQYTPTADQIVTVDTFSSNYDTVLAAFSGPKADLASNEIACNDQSGGNQSQIVVDLTAGVTYHFLVGSWQSTPGGKLVFNMVTPSSCNQGTNNDFELGVVNSDAIPCWTVAEQHAGGSGSWCIQAGTAPPQGSCAGVTGVIPAPPQGVQAAMTNQTFIDAHVMYRCNILASGSVGFQLYINNLFGVPFFSPSTLDKTVPGNQQFRADLVTKAGMEADPFTVDGADILLNIYQTEPGDPNVSGYTPITADVSAFIGQNVCLRFAVTITESVILVGIDDVQFELKKKKPGDTDGDGCPDVHENGPNAALGGQRDYKNPNDFYDVAGSPLPPQNGAPDGVVDLPNDILGVIQHHPAGTLGYDAQFDRGPWSGPNSWNETQGPDGVIDLPNDILGVILQFSHSCV